MINNGIFNGIFNLSVFQINTIVVNLVNTLLNLSGAKGIVTGTGPLLDGITSTSTVIDYAGNLITCPAGMIRRQGGRLVRNFAFNSENISLANPYNTSSTATANTVTFTAGGNGYLYQRVSTAYPAGTVVTISAVLSSNNKSTILFSANVAIGAPNSSTAKILVNLTPVPTRYSFSFTVTIAGYVEFGLDNQPNYGGDNLAGVVNIADWQMEINGAAIPSEYVSTQTTYNAGIAGAKWFDTYPANTVDVNGVVTEIVGAALPIKPVELIEPSAINLFVNPLTPATQTIALSAGTYSIYMLGSGSITLSGGATGTVTSSSKLTFTATGSTTFTVIGTVTACNVVAGDRQTSIIPSATTRSINQLNLPRIGNMRSDRGLFAFRFKRGYFGEAHLNSVAETLLSSTGINILTKLASSDTYRLSDDTNFTDITGVTDVMTDRIFALYYDQTLGIMQLATLEVGGSWVYSPVAAFNGFTFSADILKLYAALSTRIEHIALKSYDSVPQVGSLVLGPELVVNGDFSSGTASWFPEGGTLSVVNGELQITSTTTGAIRAIQQLPSVSGKVYYVTGVIRRISGSAGVLLSIIDSLGYNTLATNYVASSSTPLNVKFMFTARDSPASINLRSGNTLAIGEVYGFDNISVREIISDGFESTRTWIESNLVTELAP